MASLTFNADNAAGIVVDRFNSSVNAVNSAFNSSYGLIGTIIDVAKTIAVTNVGAIAPVDISDMPVDSPDLALLDIGTNGLPSDDEQAMWQLGLDQARKMLEDRLDLARFQWAKRGWPMATGALAQMLVAETDRYEDERRAKNIDIANRSHDLAADFARILTTFIAQWSMGTIKLNAELGLGEADLRLKQAEIAINQLLERMKLEQQAIRGASSIASELVSAAHVGTSAQASIHAGHSDSNSSRSGVSVVTSDVTSSETSTKHSRVDSRNRTINTGQGTDIEATSASVSDSDSHNSSSEHDTRQETSTSNSSSTGNST